MTDTTTSPWAINYADFKAATDPYLKGGTEWSDPNGSGPQLKLATGKTWQPSGDSSGIQFVPKGTMIGAHPAGNFDGNNYEADPGVANPADYWIVKGDTSSLTGQSGSNQHVQVRYEKQGDQLVPVGQNINSQYDPGSLMWMAQAAAIAYGGLAALPASAGGLGAAAAAGTGMTAAESAAAYDAGLAGVGSNVGAGMTAAESAAAYDAGLAGVGSNVGGSGLGAGYGSYAPGALGSGTYDAGMGNILDTGTAGSQAITGTVPVSAVGQGADLALGATAGTGAMGAGMGGAATDAAGYMSGSGTAADGAAAIAAGAGAGSGLGSAVSSLLPYVKPALAVAGLLGLGSAAKPTATTSGTNGAGTAQGPLPVYVWNPDAKKYTLSTAGADSATLGYTQGQQTGGTNYVAPATPQYAPRVDSGIAQAAQPVAGASKSGAGLATAGQGINEAAGPMTQQAASQPTSGQDQTVIGPGSAPLTAADIASRARRAAVQNIFTSNQSDPQAMMKAMTQQGVSAAELKTAMNYQLNTDDYLRNNGAADGFGGLKVWDPTTVGAFRGTSPGTLSAADNAITQQTMDRQWALKQAGNNATFFDTGQSAAAPAAEQAIPHTAAQAAADPGRWWGDATPPTAPQPAAAPAVADPGRYYGDTPQPAAVQPVTVQPTAAQAAADPGRYYGYARGGMPAPIGIAAGAQSHSRYIDGPGTGLSDSIPVKMTNGAPGRLADGEFVVSADVVSGLGGGSSKAGAKLLYAMMERIRKQAHGTTKQVHPVNPQSVLPA